MYEWFFGLNEKPFNLTPDPRYFYLSESHREALAALIYGVSERAGLITLTGPVGVGKTMILASFLDQIRDRSETASLSGAVSGNRVEFMKDLCGVLGIAPKQDTLFGVSQAVKDFAIQKAEEGRSVVVLVDEAQDLGPEELEHFHHLCNLETPEAKLVQIVLTGTEGLDEKLGEKGLEGLNQRVAIRCAIKPIGPEETIGYIFHRMRVAGSSSFEVFSDDVLWRIVNYARGVPRLINLACNQAMIVAYSLGRLPVGGEEVLEALQELEGRRSRTGTEDIVKLDEIRGMVETVSQGREEAAAPPEAERNPDTSEREYGRMKVEAEEEEGPAVRTRGWWSVFSRVSPGSRLAPGFALIVLLAMVGVVMAIGLLRARDGGIERAEVVFLEEPDAGGEGDSPEQSVLGYGTPQGGPEQVDEENEVAEAGVPASVKWTARGKDVAGIALEHYGRLDAEMLKVLKEKNPQVRDWNNLTDNVQLTLPEMPEPAGGGVDFYTIQVGAFREVQGASQRASELAARGSQNLFLVKGRVGQKLTFVCVGVFESLRESLAGVQQMQEWGYEDAFPLRIRAKRLEDILRRE